MDTTPNPPRPKIPKGVPVHFADLSGAIDLEAWLEAQEDLEDAPTAPQNPPAKL